MRAARRGGSIGRSDTINVMLRSHARVQLDIQRAHSHSRACKRYARARERACERECREPGELSEGELTRRRRACELY